MGLNDSTRESIKCQNIYITVSNYDLDYYYSYISYNIQYEYFIIKFDGIILS